MSTKLKQRFNSFSDLARCKKEGTDYKIITQEVPSCKISIIAPHGGVIEWSTSEMAKQIAANDYHLYSFEGLDQDNAFYEMHVTSSGFDEPRALALVGKTDITLTIHGCQEDAPVIHLGGKDKKLKSSLTDAFNKHGIKALQQGHPYPGTDPQNICNRNRKGEGVQLEFSRGIRRDPALQKQCVEIIREHLRGL